MKKILSLLLVLVACIGLTACTSSADRVSENLSKEAEKFNVVRSIVAVNGITDDVLFEVKGRCSVEGNGLGDLNAITAICKDGPDDYKKHYVTVPDNVSVIVTQLQGVDVSEFRSTIVFKPENIVPNFDFVTSQNTTP